MHLRLPAKWEEVLSYWRYKLLPRTLFFRTMMLIFIPLIGVQIVSLVVFFDSSWSRMGRRMADNVIDDIKVIRVLLEQGMAREDVEVLADRNLQISFVVKGVGDSLPVNYVPERNKMAVDYLRSALEHEFGAQGWQIFNDTASKTRDLVILLEDGDEVYQFSLPRKKIFSSSIFMFVVWMIATSTALLIVSMLFLRIQVRAIADLAQTSENFGKGIYEDGFKPYGSSEVRKAGLAFIKMKERILRSIMERTHMLAGISHDLRTPLTRMKLTASMMGDVQDKDDLLLDIDEMEKMLNGYLAFVRGEGDESAQEVDLGALVKNLCDRFRIEHKNLKCRIKKNDKKVRIKEQAVRRAIGNILANACRYGKKVEVAVDMSDKKANIIIDDNGPGIPQNKRDEVFRAFYRLEESRNKETGGIGLGLAITKDIIAAHGGRIMLDDSRLGGLKVVIELPI
ncbi:MAG: two-component sensor histidine kinase [Alphaproteobacteria bacterium]|nr:two-component sensor histidine kinase [Alphaproteobacteria bacterium]